MQVFCYVPCAIATGEEGGNSPLRAPQHFALRAVLSSRNFVTYRGQGSHWHDAARRITPFREFPNTNRWPVNGGDDGIRTHETLPGLLP